MVVLVFHIAFVPPLGAAGLAIYCFTTKRNSTGAPVHRTPRWPGRGLAADRAGRGAAAFTQVIYDPQWYAPTLGPLGHTFIFTLILALRLVRLLLRQPRGREEAHRRLCLGGDSPVLPGRADHARALLPGTAAGPMDELVRPWRCGGHQWFGAARHPLVTLPVHHEPVGADGGAVPDRLQPLLCRARRP